MKKAIIIAGALAMIASGAMAQGFVTFSASTSSGRPVQYTLSGAAGDTRVPLGTQNQIPTYGNFEVTAFFNTAGATLALNPSTGLPDFTGWSQASNPGRQGSVVA